MKNQNPKIKIKPPQISATMNKGFYCLNQYKGIKKAHFKRSNRLKPSIQQVKETDNKKISAYSLATRLNHVIVLSH